METSGSSENQTGSLFRSAQNGFRQASKPAQKKTYVLVAFALFVRPATSKASHGTREESMVSFLQNLPPPMLASLAYRVEFVAIAMETKAINLGQVIESSLAFFLERLHFPLVLLNVCRGCLILVRLSTSSMLCVSAARKPRTTSTPEAK